MAIQNRRGDYNDYRPNKMLSGELAVALQNDPKAIDGKALHVAFAPGVEKTLMTFEDAQGMIEDATVIAIAESVEEASGEARAWAHGDSFAKTDTFSGDGTTTAFTLTYTPSSMTAVRVGGVVVSNYTISGNVITFSTAPAVGTANIVAEYNVTNSTDNAKYYKEQAASSASSASSSSSSASSSASSASSSASAASSSASAASSSASAASGSATTATTQATKAESYAVGGTGTRTGEDTDNAKYYKEQTEAALVNRNLFFKDQAVSAMTGNILVISNAAITADHVLAECTWGNPSNITTDVTWTTAAGSLTLNGTCSSATTATITLIKKDN